MKIVTYVLLNMMMIMIMIMIMIMMMMMMMIHLLSCMHTCAVYKTVRPVD